MGGLDWVNCDANCAKDAVHNIQFLLMAMIQPIWIRASLSEDSPYNNDKEFGFLIKYSFIAFVLILLGQIVWLIITVDDLGLITALLSEAFWSFVILQMFAFFAYRVLVIVFYVPPAWLDHLTYFVAWGFVLTKVLYFWGG